MRRVRRRARPRRDGVRLRRPAGAGASPLPRRRAAPHGEQRLRARVCGPSPSDERRGSSSASDDHAAGRGEPLLAHRLVPSCTGSTPRPTSPRSSASCRTGRATATSSSRRSTGRATRARLDPRSARAPSRPTRRPAAGTAVVAELRAGSRRQSAAAALSAKGRGFAQRIVRRDKPAGRRG